MGKPAHHRRNQMRMTAYNITKARIEFQKRLEYIEALQTETINLKVEILDLQVVQNSLKIENEYLKVENSELKLSLEDISNQENKHLEELESALQAQKEDLSKRHLVILKNYSEELESRYEERFTISLNHCKSQTSDLKRQIERQSVELEAARSTILSAGTRRPVYSPGRYSASSEEVLYSENDGRLRTSVMDRYFSPT